ncbi:GMC family oxidoreductase [Kitasatospora sp. NPDC059827]|uniref:GMC family oxidoreductase n=1 Tax=Kitasatospora sp. NPDC059827 TaxID=3346964 RepID=UPI003649F332
MTNSDGSGSPTGDYDVIVVGAGSAGCVVARRAVDRGARVLLLEAGGPADNPAIADPRRFGELWMSPEDWAYTTVEQPHAAGRRLFWPRGKVLGGSSALNAMIYARGAAADYDHWAYLGNDGWSWRDVLPVYRSIEDFDRGAGEHHGAGGPLRVLSDYRVDPVHAGLIEAAAEIGIPYQEDYNTGFPEGISRTQLTILDGRRQSAADAYLAPVLGRAELTVRTGARVRRLLLDGTRCIGAEWAQGGRLHTARAAETVVSAGALESPRLLMLSGIGEPEHLRSVGLAPVVGLPGVGQGLHDHVLAPVVFATERDPGRSSAGLSPAQTHLFWRSRPGLPVPDLQPLHFPVPMYPPGVTGPPTGFTLQAGIVRPTSRGTIRLTGPDPEDHLLVDPATLRTAADRAALAAAVELCRELGAAPSLRAEWGAREVYPGPDASDPERGPAAFDRLRSTVATYHHPVGTCRMGTDAGAVVDPRLRVYGTEGLRVADASVFPAVTTGNTHAPALLVGERAAAFIGG